MTVIFDTTVSGAGDLDGYNPAPLTLYTFITVVGMSSTHDYPIGGRFFDVGWIAPYFNIDIDSDGGHHFQFPSQFIEYQYQIFQLSQYAGGLDGFHYDLGNGVSVRFVLTDDP